jgi:hypothetical protein
MNEMMGIVMGVEGKKLPIKHIPGPEGVRGRNSDNELILEKLGWQPTVRLADGLALTYKWIKGQLAKEQKERGVDTADYAKSMVRGARGPRAGGGGEAPRRAPRSCLPPRGRLPRPCSHGAPDRRLASRPLQPPPPPPDLLHRRAHGARQPAQGRRRGGAAGQGVSALSRACAPRPRLAGALREGECSTRPLD